MKKELALISDNSDVIKLFDVLKAPGMETEWQDYESLIKYVDTIENQYNSMLSEIAELKAQISGIKDKKNPLAVMAENMESAVSDIGMKIRNIKDGIISFTKNALEIIKDKGLSARGSVFSFLNIKDSLKAMSNGLEKSIATAENSVKKIEAMSREYHEMGNNARNIGRIFMGRESNEAIKANGKLAAAMKLPFIGIKNAFTVMDETVNIAAAKIESFERYYQEKAQQALQPDVEATADETVQSGKSAAPTEIATMLTELQPELSEMPAPELRSMYQVLLEIGMSKDITADDNTALQATIDKIETILPHTGEYEATEFPDWEQGVEM